MLRKIMYWALDIVIRIVVVGGCIKAADYCLFGFDHPVFPAEDILAIAGVVICAANGFMIDTK